MDSDIPVPYGRAIEKEIEPNFIIQKEFNKWRRSKRNDVLVAIMGSNCGSKNHRWQYVKELKKHITVDAYGNCGTLKYINCKYYISHLYLMFISYFKV